MALINRNLIESEATMFDRFLNRAIMFSFMFVLVFPLVAFPDIPSRTDCPECQKFVELLKDISENRDNTMTQLQALEAELSASPLMVEEGKLKIWQEQRKNYPGIDDARLDKEIKELKEKVDKIKAKEAEAARLRRRLNQLDFDKESAEWDLKTCEEYCKERKGPLPPLKPTVTCPRCRNIAADIDTTKREMQIAAREIAFLEKEINIVTKAITNQEVRMTNHLSMAGLYSQRVDKEGGWYRFALEEMTTTIMRLERELYADKVALEENKAKKADLEKAAAKLVKDLKECEKQCSPGVPPSKPGDPPGKPDSPPLTTCPACRTEAEDLKAATSRLNEALKDLEELEEYKRQMDAEYKRLNDLEMYKKAAGAGAALYDYDYEISTARKKIDVYKKRLKRKPDVDKEVARYKKIKDDAEKKLKECEKKCQEKPAAMPPAIPGPETAPPKPERPRPPKPKPPVTPVQPKTSCPPCKEMAQLLADIRLDIEYNEKLVDEFRAEMRLEEAWLDHLTKGKPGDLMLGVIMKGEVKESKNNLKEIQDDIRYTEEKLSRLRQKEEKLAAELKKCEASCTDGPPSITPPQKPVRPRPAKPEPPVVPGPVKTTCPPCIEKAERLKRTLLKIEYYQSIQEKLRAELRAEEAWYTYLTDGKDPGPQSAGLLESDIRESRQEIRDIQKDIADTASYLENLKAVEAKDRAELKECETACEPPPSIVPPPARTCPPCTPELERLTALVNEIAAKQKKQYESQSLREWNTLKAEVAGLQEKRRIRERDLKLCEEKCSGIPAPVPRAPEPQVPKAEPPAGQMPAPQSTPPKVPAPEPVPPKAGPGPEQVPREPLPKPQAGTTPKPATPGPQAIPPKTGLSIPKTGPQPQSTPPKVPTPEPAPPKAGPGPGQADPVPKPALPGGTEPDPGLPGPIPGTPLWPEPSAPVRTCPPCEQELQRLTAVVEEIKAKQKAYQDDTASVIDFNVLSKEIRALRTKRIALEKELKRCEDACSGVPSQPPGECPTTPFQPVIIGPQSKYGSSASGTAADVAKNVLGGVLGGFFGGGRDSSPGSMGPGSDSPPLGRNPFENMQAFSDAPSNTSISIAGKQTEEGFLLAAGIKDGDGKPTIHSMTLHRDDDCTTILPSEYVVYQLWGKWQLSVSWSRTTYVNNRQTSHTSGGWSKSGTMPLSVFGPGGEGSAWQALGFDKATGGPRELGAKYLVPKGQPVKFPDKAIVHITQPGKDPVTTVPYIFKVSQQPGGAMGFQQIMPGVMK